MWEIVLKLKVAIRKRVPQAHGHIHPIVQLLADNLHQTKRKFVQVATASARVLPQQEHATQPRRVHPLKLAHGHTHQIVQLLADNLHQTKRKFVRVATVSAQVPLPRGRVARLQLAYLNVSIPTPTIFPISRLVITNVSTVPLFPIQTLVHQIILIPIQTHILVPTVL